MPMLTAEKLIIAFKKLNSCISDPDEPFKNLVRSAQNSNAWFRPREVQRALDGLQQMLNAKDLEQWFSKIKVSDTPKRIGLILAGNIPMVGFHDVLCVLATGHTALIKLSSSDDKLLPALLSRLTDAEPLLKDRIIYTERLMDFDAVIATGSNNTSRYFDHYFGKVPHIIRRNRNSVAILTGNESPEQLAALGHDIFDYYGMGCRNVSKIYIPEGYDIAKFYVPLEPFKSVRDHFKYSNNYDYNKSIYLVNQTPHFDNGFLLLKEDKGLSSPLAVLFFERYNDLSEVIGDLAGQHDNIQCMVSAADLGPDLQQVGFGETQRPRLWDYADNVDTIDFLSKI